MKFSRICKKGVCIFLLFIASIGFGISVQASELRCIVFYSNIKGVYNTISYIADSISEHLTGSDDISLSVYNLSQELYDSTQYKAQVAEAMDMDVIILSGRHSSTETEGYELLKKAGIHLILVDGDNSSSDRCAYIGTDNYQEGAETAEIFAEKMEICQAGILSSPVQEAEELAGSRKQRRDGFVSAAKDLENLTIAGECTCSSDTLEAMDSIRSFLDEHPEVNALFCTDSASGIAASKVLRERGEEDKVYVTCFDFPQQVEEELRKNGIDEVIIQDTFSIGAACAELLQELQTNPCSISNEEVLLPCNHITLANLESLQ